MKHRSGDPFMPAPEYAHTLAGLTVNLLVRDVAASLRFQVEVLGASVVYSDPDFAVLRFGGAEWSLHADHTYAAHPLHTTLAKTAVRGTGAELRLHSCDPDKAVAAAGRLGFGVLAPAADKPHGLREAYILDPDGYLWVPDVHSADTKP
jgi:catechol 2,3-dioxygenase-like lactoylglutathione lyase family enzyme